MATITQKIRILWLPLALSALAGCAPDPASGAAGQDPQRNTKAAVAVEPESVVQAASAIAADAIEAANTVGVAATNMGGHPGADCDDEDIACFEKIYELEEALSMYEAGVSKQLDPPALACWQSDSEAFRRTTNACDNVECREAALRERLASLHYLQDEAFRTRLDLPQVPILLAVLGREDGPDDDTAASPTAPEPPDLEIRGDLVHAFAHAEHMGIAVRTAGGADHVFILDMDIDNQGPQDQVLGLVGTSPTARILVRGHELMAPDGIANFDPSRCRLVYQLP